MANPCSRILGWTLEFKKLGSASSSFETYGYRSGCVDPELQDHVAPAHLYG